MCLTYGLSIDNSVIDRKFENFVSLNLKKKSRSDSVALFDKIPAGCEMGTDFAVRRRKLCDKAAGLNY